MQFEKISIPITQGFIPSLTPISRVGSRIFLRRGCTSNEWRHWRWGKKNLKVNTKKKASSQGGGGAPPAPSPQIRPWSHWIFCSRGASSTPPPPGISMTFLLGSPYPLEIWYLLGTVIKFSQSYSCLNCKPWFGTGCKLFYCTLVMGIFTTSGSKLLSNKRLRLSNLIFQNTTWKILDMHSCHVKNASELTTDLEVLHSQKHSTWLFFIQRSFHE